MAKALILAVLALLIIVLWPRGERELQIGNVTVKVRDGILFKRETTKYPARIFVTEHLEKLGVSIDPHELHFGRVAPNMSVRKRLNVHNGYDLPVKVNLVARGNISAMLSFEPRDFILQPNQSQEVEVKAVARTVGNYTGEVHVVVNLPKYGWLTSFLSWT